MAKPLQYCKVICVQLKWINVLKKKKKQNHMECYSANQKEGNLAICNTMNEP